MSTEAAIEESKPEGASHKEARKSDAIHIYGAARLLFSHAYRSEIVWHLSLSFLISAFAGLLGAVSEGFRSELFFSFWLGSLMLALVCMLILHRARSARLIWNCGIVLVVLSYANWVCLGYFDLFIPETRTLWLLVLSLVILSAPWPGRFLPPIVVIAVLVALEPFRFGVGYLPLYVGILAFIAFCSRLSSMNFLRFMTTVGASFINRTLEGLKTPIGGIHALAVLARELADSDCAIVVSQGGEVQRVKGTQLEYHDEQSIYAKSMVQRVIDYGSEVGVFNREDLGEQFNATTRTWFGFFPSRILFIRIPLVAENKEEAGAILVPVTSFVAVSGVNRIVESLRSLAVPVRLALHELRRNVFTSDVLRTVQREAGTREEELNQVIHHVNNVAQDISVHCERCRTALAGIESENSQAIGDVLAQVGELEDISKNLASGVSDVKLLKELIRISVFNRTESVDIAELLAELESFCRFLSARYGIGHRLETELPEGSSVQVVSQQYLETCLRYLLRVVSRGAERGSSISLVVKRSGRQGVKICISRDGFIAEEQLRSSFGAAGSDLQSVESAILRVIEAADGTVRVDGASSGSDQISFELKGGEAAVSSSEVSGDWVLLVDDDREITTFYTRLVDVLGFNSYAAEDVSSAKKLIELHGEPHLVITDVQLENENGLDLLEQVRERFGSGPIVLVVSGEADSDVVGRAYELGASRVLTKPVGRKKLFGAIESLISGTVEESN